MNSRTPKPSTTPAPPAKEPAKAEISPVKERVGEGDKNLSRRREWFERRTKKDT